MTKNDIAQGLIKTIADHLKAVSAGLVSVSLIATALWWAFGPRIEESARQVVGFNELNGAIVQQGVAIEGLAENVGRLDARVARIEPRPAVAEYDILRSQIDPVCAPGGACHYSYRVRRTDAGAECGAPSAQRVLIDGAGSTFFPPVAPSQSAIPQRLGEEWAVVTSAFTVPMRAVPGTSEFFLRIEYEDCNGEALQPPVVEESPRLILDIERAR